MQAGIDPRILLGSVLASRPQISGGLGFISRYGRLQDSGSREIVEFAQDQISRITSKFAGAFLSDRLIHGFHPRNQTRA